MGICFALTDRMGFSRGWLMNGGDLSAKSSKGVDDSVCGGCPTMLFHVVKHYSER